MHPGCWLADGSLAHLRPMLASAGATLEEAAGLLAVSRPRCLAYLKASGVDRLADRQALAGAVGRAVKSGSLTPARLVEASPDEALHEACRHGDAAAARDALGAGADAVAAPRHDGLTPLLAACDAGAAECVRLLLSARASTERAQPRGPSPLGVAAMRGHMEVAEALLEAGAAYLVGVERPPGPGCDDGREERPFAPPPVCGGWRRLRLAA